MLIVDGQLNTDKEGAIRFLGMSETMFDEYQARKIIRPLRKGLYNYQDLADSVESIRKERDKVIELQVAHEDSESTLGPVEKEMGGKGNQSGYRSTPELLRGLGG